MIFIDKLKIMIYFLGFIIIIIIIMIIMIGYMCLGLCREGRVEHQNIFNMCLLNFHVVLAKKYQHSS